MADLIQKKRVFINKDQKEALADFMEANPRLKNPTKLTNKTTKNDIDRLWETLATTLNKLGEITGGAVKDSNSWKKTWHDLKSNIKKKASEKRRHALSTGGGSPMEEGIVDIADQKIEDMLILTEIEGDVNISESMVSFENKFNRPSTSTAPDFPLEVLETTVNYEVPAIVEIHGTKPTSEGPPNAKNINTKAGRLAETLKVSHQISKEILEKTSLKRDYYRSNLELKKENIKIKKEKLELKREDVEAKREIANSLQEIATILKLNFSDES